MYFDNLVRVLTVTASYIVLIFGLGIIMLKPLAQKRTFSERVLMYFISGNFFVMTMIYLLLFFRCNSRIVTIFALLTGAFAIRLLYDANNMAIDISRRVETLALLSRGVYGWRYYFKTVLSTCGTRIHDSLMKIVKSYLFETLMITGCFIIQAIYMGVRYIISATFAASDEPVHLRWIQEMVTNGNLYYEGKIYPYGMHNIVYAVIKVFDLKAYMVYRNFGFVMNLLLLMLLFFLIKRVYRSRYAPLIGVFLYVGGDLFNYTAWDRLQYCIPMEYGSLFLYPMVIFLYHYICRRERIYLLFLCICFSMTLFVHSYDAIIAMILCLSIGVTGLYRIIKGKIFIKLILMGMLAGIVGLMPMGIGLLTGHELQGSFTWAADVIQGTAVSSDIDTIVNKSAPAIDTGQVTPDEPAIIDEAEHEHSVSLYNRLIQLPGQLKVAAVICYNKTYLYLMKDKNQFFVIWLIAAILLTVLRALLHGILRSKREEAFLQLAISVYMVVILTMMCCDKLGIPVLIEDYRISEYVAYAYPLLLCIPLEYIYLLAERKILLKKIVNACIILLTTGIIFFTYFSGFSRIPGRYTIVNSDNAVKVFYKIVNEYEDYKWTIVSTVDEYSMVLDVGRHGDWLEFLTSLSGYYPGMRIEFPTDDIFFFIEKHPIVPTDICRVNEVKQYPAFEAKDAKINLGDVFYSNKSDYYKFRRNMIMAKAYYWAEEYRHYFPEEMTVFYEDDDFICYHLKQEPAYLNNLAIDYPYNTIH